VKSHYINPVNKVEEFNSVGVPQGGSVLTPILSNIYLHELDKFMQNKIEKSKKSDVTSTRRLTLTIISLGAPIRSAACFLWRLRDKIVAAGA
jgi:retron-type reverse transcriptase